ncbi:hypothetical protein [Nakamurella sp.]|uniref:hypothetical protein n=1 Tax=Nakamurella sp. TaxID=1869182 RepID=UPI003784D434
MTEATEATEVARSALVTTRDPATRNMLSRLLVHTAISTGRTDAALQLIAHYLPESHTDPDYEHALIHLRRWISVLSGREP